MALSEADTRAKLIDPALHFRGWAENLIKGVPTRVIINEELGLEYNS
jgi:type I site-specific restriction endonuclease